MSQTKVAAALFLAAIALAAAPAQALVAIPDGTAVGSALDQLTISGSYASLPDPAVQPFAATDFTLSLTIPSQVSVTGGPVVSAFVIPANGSYTNDGVTTSFSNQFATFGATDTATADHFTLIVGDLLQPADSFVLEFQANGALFSPATFSIGEPTILTFTTGSFDVSDGNGSATYDNASDPNFAATVAIASLTAVPEPMSLALFLPALGGLWLLRRRR